MKYRLLLLIIIQTLFVGVAGAQGIDCFESTRARGISLFEQKKYDDAIKQFEAAEACPDKKTPNDLSAQIKKCKDAKVAAGEGAKRRGISLFEQKKYDEAIRQFNAASVYLDKKDQKELSDWIKKCREEKAVGEEAKEKGVALFEQKKYDEAIEQFDAAKDFFDEKGQKNLSDWIEKSVDAKKLLPGGTASDSIQIAEEDQKLKEWRKVQEEEAAKTAYMNIRGIEFANAKNNSLELDNTDIIHPFSSDLYASDIKFLAARLYYNSAINWDDKKVVLQIKLISPQGELLSNETSPSGYTLEMNKEIYGGQINQFIDILSWGDDSQRMYYPGIWKLELWYNNQNIYQSSVNLLKKPHEATYLTVNNEKGLYLNLDAAGGNIDFNVDTDANVWRLKNLPKWCDNNRIEEKTFSLQYKTNTDIPRIDTLIVVADDKEVNIRLSQAQGTVSVSKNKWRNALHKVFDHVTIMYDWMPYQGSLSSQRQNGLGIAREDNYVYVGEWQNGYKKGTGIYICNDDVLVPNCKKSTYFVGNFSNDQKNGMGYCFNKSGDLIYTGEFANDAPIEKYPSKDNSKDKTFGRIEYSNGAAYIGEVLKKDKREMKHGQGIHIWANGDAWYGNWDEDKRSGKGIFLQYDGGIIVGTWDGDNFEREE